jgi:dTDP-4-dehydrorhamnose 3,5-epimerase-like enzyme
MKMPEPEAIEIHSDARGALHKVFPWPVTGEVYAVRVAPGALRGCHLHRISAEFFAVVGGPLRLLLVDPITREKATFELRDQRVRVPAGLAHAVWAPLDARPDTLLLAAMERPHDPADTVPVEHSLFSGILP